MKKVIIISGVNLSEGGPLTIIKEALYFLDKSDIRNDYEIFALVYSKELFPGINNINLLEYPNIKKSWFRRIKFEYLDCIKISKELKSYLWFSLHDVTPNVVSEKKCVYCHNASPFYKMRWSRLFSVPRQFVYMTFYKQLYKINIKKNNYIVVQQKWIKDKFIQLFKIAPQKIIVSLPNQTQDRDPIKIGYDAGGKFTFFYPAYPRTFKNFEVICKAAEIISAQGVTNFEVILTIDGSENSYSKKIVDKYKFLPEIKFVGLLSRDRVENYYQKASCLLFPSKLETWGLPISEFKRYNKPILASDLPFAYETAGDYDFIKYINPDKAEELAKEMLNAINGTIKFSNKGDIRYEMPICRNWNELFKYILK